MGDTAPPQAPTGGLGGAPGAGLLGGGSVTPRVHSAIVERLRARIAVCRQHHLSCEGRYERGRAESSDRERESTLQLLSLVQHGQGARKAGKHAKATASTAPATAAPPAPAAPPPAPPTAAPAAPAPPPDYRHHQQHLRSSGGSGGIDGEQQPPPPASAPGDQRNSALIALQGSLKRKQIVNLSPANSKRPNGFVDNSFLDIKRIRVSENLAAGPAGLPVNNGQSQMMSGTLPMSQAPLRKTATLPPPPTHSPGNGLFNMGLKEVKKEPGETLSCSKHGDGQVTQENIFSNRYGDDPGEQLMDPELQELFNELTNISVPPMSDLELENMINATIKQDDPFNIDLGQQSQRSTPRPSLPLEKTVIKSEYSPGLTQGPSGSPQLRPSSAGPPFSMANSGLSASSPIPSVPQSQAQPPPASGAARALPSWQEVSHAQQLKQIAANRQQHVRMHQHQQQQQPASWPALPSSAGPSPGPFGQEKIPSPSFGQQQPFSPQSTTMPGVAGGGNPSKVMANYLYKASPSAQGGPLDVLLQPKPQDLSRSFLSTPHPAMEPRHGSTKPLFHFNSDQANQQMPSVLPSQSKPSLLHYTQQQPQQSSVTVQPQQQPPQPQPPQPPPPQQPQPPPQPPAQQPAAQPTQPLSNQPLLRAPLPLQQKILLQKMQNQPITGLGYQVSPQHRQDQHSVVGQNAGPSPSPSPCSNPNTGSGYMNSQQSLLNQQLMGKKQTLQRQIMEQKQQLLLQQQMLADAEKIAPQDQINRHLTRPPPDYKDQRRNVGNMQPAAQYSGGSSTANLNSNQALANPVSTHTILTPNSSLMSPPHGTRMPSLPTGVQNVGMFGNLPCGQPSTYSVTSGMSQLTQPRNPNQLIANQNSPLMPRPPTLGPSNNNNNNVATFGAGSVGSSQPLRPNLTHSMASMPAQRTSNVMITSNTAAPNWASQEATAKQQEALKSAGVRFPAGTTTAYAPNQSLPQAVGSQQFSQRAVAPSNQLTPAVQMRPMNQMSQTLNGQNMGPLRSLNLRPNQLSTQILPTMNQAGTGLSQSRTVSQPPSLAAGGFPSPNQSSRAFQGTDHGSDLAFDFLNQQTDNMGPALNSDVDFIDSLLKTEPGNDDWMKDINLDEILGNNS